MSRAADRLRRGSAVVLIAALLLGGVGCTAGAPRATSSGASDTPSGAESAGADASGDRSAGTGSSGEGSPPSSPESLVGADGRVQIDLRLDPDSGQPTIWFEGAESASGAEALAEQLKAAARAFGQFEENASVPGRRDSLLEVFVRVESSVGSEVIHDIYQACMAANVYRVRVAALESSAPTELPEEYRRELAPRREDACVVVLERVPTETTCTVGGRRISTEKGEFEEGRDLPPAPRLAEIEAELLRLKESYRGPAENGLAVVIDFEPEVHWKYVVDVLNVCHRLGIEEISFAAPEIPEF